MADADIEVVFDLPVRRSRAAPVDPAEPDKADAITLEACARLEDLRGYTQSGAPWRCTDTSEPAQREVVDPWALAQLLTTSVGSGGPGACGLVVPWAISQGRDVEVLRHNRVDGGGDRSSVAGIVIMGTGGMGREAAGLTSHLHPTMRALSTRCAVASIARVCELSS